MPAALIEMEPPLLQGDAPLMEGTAALLQEKAPLIEMKRPLLEIPAPLRAGMAALMREKAPLVEMKRPLVEIPAPLRAGMGSLMEMAGYGSKGDSATHVCHATAYREERAGLQFGRRICGTLISTAARPNPRGGRETREGVSWALNNAVAQRRFHGMRYRRRRLTIRWLYGLANPSIRAASALASDRIAHAGADRVSGESARRASVSCAGRSRQWMLLRRVLGTVEDARCTDTAESTTGHITQTLHWTGATTVLVNRTLVVGPGQ